MNSLLIRAAAPFLGMAMLGFVATAAMLPTSTLLVHVLSVTQKSSNRVPLVINQGQVVEWQHNTVFVAKVQIEKVIRSDHGLTPGATIEIDYTIRTGTPRALAFQDAPLRPGESVTLSVFQRAGGYELRR